MNPAPPGPAPASASAAVTPSPRPPRALAVALLLALVGLALAATLVWEHARAHAGATSFCAINETVNCDRVATSPYAVVLGLPVAAWGVLGYALAAALAGLGFASGRPHARWPRGLLVGVAVLSVFASIALALVSEFAIGALCLLCAGSWLTTALLLFASWRSLEGTSPAAALREDLAALRARPLLAVTAVAVLLAVVAVAEAAYPRYWEKPPAAAAAPPGAPSAAAATPDAGGVLTVTEFSDYECPFCAKAHEANKAVFGGRSDIKLVRRQYPLDPTCNPAVHRAVHLTACSLARAALCAGAQGKFDAMDDALFANQSKNEPVEAIAQRLGLDMSAFGVCLDAPETSRKLAADVEAGARAQVTATPSYVVNGVTYAGEIPPGVLPPRPR